MARRATFASPFPQASLRSAPILACLALPATLLLQPVGAAASTLTIPWTLDFSFVSAPATGVVSAGVGSGVVALETFDARHEIGARVKGSVGALGIDVAGVDVRAGLRFPVEAATSYTVRLPYEITFTAPDSAAVGGNVFIGTDVKFAGAPSFAASGRIDFDTEAFLKGHAFVGPFDGDVNLDVTLPDKVSVSGGTATFGGSGTYSDQTGAVREVSASAFAKTSLLDGAPVASDTARYLGLALTTEGEIDGPRGGVNLLAAAQSIPVVGQAAAIADIPFDLDLEAGVAISERSTLSTGAVYALYSEDSGAGERKAVPINALGAGGFSVRVPDDAVGSYGIDLFGLGVGFGLERDLLMTPELELVLDALWPLGEWRLFGLDLGDPWTIGRQYSSFQFEEYFSFSNYPRYIAPEDRILSFELGGLASEAPALVDPGLPEGIAAPAAPYTTVSLPGDAPTAWEVEYVAPVPLPPTSFALLSALAGLATLRRVLHRRAAATAR